MTAAHPVRAVLLFNLGLLLFACMDVTNKYLTASFDVPLIGACRYIGNLLLMLAFVAPTRARAMVQTQRTGLVWLRGACLVISSLCVLMAFQRMPVAETSAIVFLAPILVVIAAGPLLGERIGRRGWVGALFGFSGVLLIVRPGSGLDMIGVLYALGCVAAVTAYNLMSRLLAPSERTMAMLFYTALIGSLVFGAALPWFWFDKAPTLFDGALLAGLGMIGGLGHFLFTAAFRDAPASVLAPMSYLQLLWVALLGWLVFDHVPDAISLLGIAIIGVAGVTVALKARQATEESA